MSKNNKNNTKQYKKIYSNKKDPSSNKIISYTPLHNFKHRNINRTHYVNEKIEEIIKRIDKRILTYKKK